MGFLAGGLLSAGGSLLGGLFGKSAAEQAAEEQAKAAQQGINAIQQGQQAGVDYQTGVANEQRNLLNPYAQAGQGATTSLASMLAPGGNLTQGYGNFEAPTGVTEQNDPGYQFRLQQGQQALENSAAARGGLFSGNTAKALSDYAQGSASNEYQNVYNRALGNYQTNYNTFRNNQNDLYSRLMGLSGQGLGAASTLGGELQSGAGNMAGIYGNSAQSIANLLGQQGAARASGYVGGANALAGGLGGAANDIGGVLTLRSLLGGQQQQPNNTIQPYFNMGES
jgi:hypothetical protein